MKLIEMVTAYRLGLFARGLMGSGQPTFPVCELGQVSKWFFCAINDARGKDTRK